MSRNSSTPTGGPLGDLDEWDDDVRRRYPRPAGVNTEPGSKKKSSEFRDYRAEVRPCVKEFYRQNHTRQTLEFVKAKRAEYQRLDKKQMGVWEALELLNTLVDDSDPDSEMPQIEHALQTAEGVRRAGLPGWFILTGLIHDLGKVLCFFDEPQWAVVGDTFPLGCRFSEKIVFHEFFADNPDSQVPAYQTQMGIYKEGCGLEHVHMSWGHDEYLYWVVRDYLPAEALAMIRYHSFYPAHREGAYAYLMNEHDREMFGWVNKFNPFDLYTKVAARPNVAELTPFYRELIDEFFPARIRW